MSKAAVGFGRKRKPAALHYSLAGFRCQRPPSGLVARACMTSFPTNYRTLQPESASSTLKPPSDFVARASVDCILQGLQPKSASSIVRPPSGLRRAHDWTRSL